MQFQVPQFIEVEDKIFGPFSLRQFIYLAGGAGFAAIMITVLGIFFGVLLSLPVVILAAALAFYRINNRPFIDVLQSAAAYFASNRLYIWQKEERPPEQQPLVEEKKDDTLGVPKLSSSRLKDLAWSLDIKESSIYSDKKQR